jgi:MOSC domain-containing protein YiiM
LFFYEPRIPCEKMDRICQGLRALMENNRQGVLAQVVRTGIIRVGDTVAELAFEESVPPQNEKATTFPLSPNNAV